MQRGFLALAVVATLVQYARPKGDTALIVTLTASSFDVDARHTYAMVNFRVSNRSWAPVYLPETRTRTPLIIEHQVGDQWLIHRRLPLICMDGFNRLGQLGVNHGMPCSGGVTVQVPGRFRLRVIEPPLTGSAWRSITSNPFIVRNVRTS